MIFHFELGVVAGYTIRKLFERAVFWYLNQVSGGKCDIAI